MPSSPSVVDRRRGAVGRRRPTAGPLRSYDGGTGSDGDGGGRGSAMMRLPYYERLMENIPPASVIDAVERAGGDPVAASDLAASAGISLSRARRELTNLAALTRGDIAVSADGELTYTFPKDARGAISSNSAKYRAMRVWNDRVYPPLLYATKLGFGVVLFASLVAIFSTIFFAMSSGGSSDREEDRRDGRRGGGGGMGMMGGFWGPSPFDFFFYRPYYSRYYYSPAALGGDGGRRQQQSGPDEMGFLESVFSYVFGDGDPNGDVEERRITLAASMIRENGGAVTAEQLAPYCDDAPMPLRADSSNNGKLGEERAYVDESFVLPIVTQLDGEPRVTDEGDIVYVFPELMTSASSSSPTTTGSSTKKTGGATSSTGGTTREWRILRRAGLDEDAPTSMIGRLLTMNGISTRGALERSDLVDMLERALPDDGAATNADVDDEPGLLLEREYKFSLASSFQTVLAGLLGVVNLGGALYLGNILGQYAIYGVRLPSYMGLVQQFFPLLLGYAVLFNAVPLARNFLIQGKNEKIRRRNEARRSWRAVLEEKAGGVGRKLMSAARFGKRMRQLGAGGDGDIVFDTSKGIGELDKAREREAMKDFDKILDGKESSWE